MRAPGEFANVYMSSSAARVKFESRVRLEPSYNFFFSFSFFFFVYVLMAVTVISASTMTSDRNITNIIFLFDTIAG